MPQKSLAVMKVRKKVDQMDKMIQETLVDNLETLYIPTAQDLILQDYDTELTGAVVDRRSRTNPIFYRDEFEEALENFEWITEKRNETIINIPETDTFNWNQGRLSVIKNIVEGTIGTFVEIDAEQYVAMYKRHPVRQPFDKTVPLKERIYLIRLTNDVRRRWREAYPGNDMVRYPFSNRAPIDIFASANKYVEENMKKWIGEAITEVQKEITR